MQKFKCKSSAVINTELTILEPTEEIFDSIYCIVKFNTDKERETVRNEVLEYSKQVLSALTKNDFIIAELLMESRNIYLADITDTKIKYEEVLSKSISEIIHLIPPELHKYSQCDFALELLESCFQYTNELDSNQNIPVYSKKGLK